MEFLAAKAEEHARRWAGTFGLLGHQAIHPPPNRPDYL